MRDLGYLVELYKAGLSLRDVSYRTGVPRETIRFWLHRMEIPMRHLHPIYSPPRSILDSDSALLLGLHAGNGWISGRWGISLHSSDTNMITEVMRLAREVLGVDPGVSRNNDHTTTVWSHKEQAVQFFLNYGFPAGRKSAIVTAPGAILSGNYEVKRSFLKGVFSTDGCFFRLGTRGECRFEVASIALRDDFVSLASDLGFAFRSYTYIHHGGHNKLPLHTAYLGRQPEVLRWMEEIGSLCDTHVCKFEAMINALRGVSEEPKPF